VLPRAQGWGVFAVVIIYFAVNICYALIIPRSQLFTPGGIDVSQAFLQLTIGNMITDPARLVTFANICKAISVFGSMIVVTFTTARVKQEIAKEGILPFSKFFAESYDFSLDRLLGHKKDEPFSAFSEYTPAGTLLLHWAITSILVVVPVLAIQPVPYSSTAAYSYLTISFVYNIDLVMFTAISIGLLYLRFTPRIYWAEKSAFKRPWISITSATILLVTCAFPLIFMWVPDPIFPWATRTGNQVRWFGGQVLAVAFLTFAFAYWLGFRTYITLRSAREGKTLHVKREPKFKVDRKGNLIMVAEIVTLQWTYEVGMRLGEIEERGSAAAAVVNDEGMRQSRSTMMLSPATSAPVEAPAGFSQRRQTYELDGVESRFYAVFKNPNN